MSRYRLSAKDASQTVTVGWDNPLETFFAQVENADEELVLWLGADPKEPKITDIAVLQEKLKEYTIIPDNIWEKLEQDYINRREPNAFQKKMMKLMEDNL